MKPSLCGVLVIVAFFIGLLIGYGLSDGPVKAATPAAAGAQ